ncbi:ABC transporter permease [Halalkalibacter akibai]|uniref:ABC peptide transporter n=1 Tax=Halalkalibacter akibai (strain ATCC 43226 / DSM 21942 / CIP 109018 / JCM 9157 / 1139) TaxID=1236973 RepID=W4QPJ6_HALA3|nr:ABC transporter permease subunit [Halalkalibacter akibai]GAE33583.1 ABC peptide transporter [Halalkalibacter akibai JCM 9157]
MNNKSLWIAVVLLLFFLFLSFVEFIPGVDLEINEQTIIIDGREIERAPFAPSSSYWFGSDREGRDLFTMIIKGTRDTILIILAITTLRYVIAIPLAFLAVKKTGFFHGLLHSWNLLFSALPTIFSAILLMTFPFVTLADQRWLAVIVILACVEVGRVGYFFQQQAFDLGQELFVQAGRSIGHKPIGMLIHYYLPNLFPTIVTQFFLDMGRTALLIGQLGIFSVFITHSWIQLSSGYGEFVNTSFNWPSLLGTVREDFRHHFWIPFFPALALTILMITFQLFSEGLRKHFASKYNQAS